MEYYRDEPYLNNASNIIDFSGKNKDNSVSFKLEKKITGQTGDDGSKDVNIMEPLKYLSNFRRTLEMPPINCRINLILIWSAKYFIVASTVVNQVPTFAITLSPGYNCNTNNAKSLQ